MRRYSMKRNITYYLRLTFALLLLSLFLNYYPVLLQAKTSLCFFKSHLFMFLVVNSIVLVVLLSNSPSSSSSRIEYVGFSYQPDHVYEEYVAISRARFCENTVVADKDQEEEEEEEEEEEASGKVYHEEKKKMEMIMVTDAGEVVVDMNSQTPILEEVNMVVVNARPAEVINNYDHLNSSSSSSYSSSSYFNNNNNNNDLYNNNNNNSSNKHNHRRSRSEMWRRENDDRLMTMSGGGDHRGRVRELRRSESTKIGKGGGGAWRSTDAAELGKMNNEEFRLTIENFIATRKKLLRDENVSLSHPDLSITTTTTTSSSSTNNNVLLFHSTTNNTELLFV